MNKDLIKQKISEALSASFSGDELLIKWGDRIKLFGQSETVEDGLMCLERRAGQNERCAYVYGVAVGLEDARRDYAREKEKRESEIKSALETIDWEEILK